MTSKISNTLIIAEAGVNHNGKISLALQLVEAAAKSGADYVKFQTFKTEQLVVKDACKAEYQMLNTSRDESQFTMLRALELTPAMHEIIQSHCKLCGIGFLSTAFDIESAEYLESLGVEKFKISSGDLTNLPYLHHIGRYNKPVILSTGMATIDEIEDALKILESSGLNKTQISILHCSTDYPAPVVDVNLRAISTMHERFNLDVGYSDHTIGIEVPIAAVALGAKIIEKHITLDRNLPGPDHTSSLEPLEFALMVKSIRSIELAMGNGCKIPSISELKNRDIVRKSIVALAPIKAGEIFNKDNITAKRPGCGISPMRWNDVLGRAATRNFAIDELIEI